MPTVAFLGVDIDIPADGVNVQLGADGTIALVFHQFSGVVMLSKHTGNPSVPAKNPDVEMVTPVKDKENNAEKPAKETNKAKKACQKDSLAAIEPIDVDSSTLSVGTEPTKHKRKTKSVETGIESGNDPTRCDQGSEPEVMVISERSDSESDNGDDNDLDHEDHNVHAKCIKNGSIEISVVKTTGKLLPKRRQTTVDDFYRKKPFSSSLEPIHRPDSSEGMNTDKDLNEPAPGIVESQAHGSSKRVKAPPAGKEEETDTEKKAGDDKPEEHGTAAPPAKKARKRASKATVKPAKEGLDTPVIVSTKWESVSPKPTEDQSESVPKARWGCTLTKVGESLYLYGGDTMDELSGLAGGMSVYDAASNTWTHRPVRESSSKVGHGRAWHTTVVNGKNLIIFGGEQDAICGTFREPMSDTFVYDTEFDSFYPPFTQGSIPAPRSGHAACMVNQNMFIFGGIRGRKWLNDMYVLDTEKWEWSRKQVSGQIPSARSYHSMTAFSTETVVIFGGNDEKNCFNDVYVFNSVSGHFWKPQIFGPAPGGRCGHIAVACDHYLYIFGGWDQPDQFDDMHVLNTKTWQWEVVDESLRHGFPAVVGTGVASVTDGEGNTGGVVATYPSALVFGGLAQNAALSNQLYRVHCQAAEHHEQPTVIDKPTEEAIGADTSIADVIVDSNPNMPADTNQGEGDVEDKYIETADEPTVKQVELQAMPTEPPKYSPDLSTVEIKNADANSNTSEEQQPLAPSSAEERKVDESTKAELQLPQEPAVMGIGTVVILNSV